MKYDLSLFQHMLDPTPEVIIETFPQMDSSYEPWWEWEPETIEDSLPGDTSHRKGLIQACASLVRQSKSEFAHHTHWREPDIFGSLCVEFDGVAASVEYFEKPTLSQILYCHHVMNTVDSNLHLEDGVKEYISICVTEHGIIYVPGMLSVNKIIAERLEGREGFSKELVFKLEETLMSPEKRQAQVESPDPSSPLNVQVLRIVSAFQLFNERRELAKRQINSMKRLS